MKNRQGRLFMLAEVRNNRMLDMLSGIRPVYPDYVTPPQAEVVKLSNRNAVRTGDVIRVRKARG